MVWDRSTVLSSEQLLHGFEIGSNSRPRNGFRYQVFAGFGFVPLSEVPTAWAAGEEILVLCRVNVINGTAAFSIVDDAWTSDINNNGDYFISLNGLDRTVRSTRSAPLRTSPPRRYPVLKWFPILPMTTWLSRFLMARADRCSSNCSMQQAVSFGARA